MSEQLNNTGHKHWGRTNNQQRLPLEDFLTSMREYLVTITAALENLQSAYLLIEKQGKFQHDQYNFLIDLAYSMDNPVQGLLCFLDQRACLPIAILPLRYQLTTKLHTIKEFLWVVLALIGSLRSTRKTSPQENAMTRYNFLKQLDALLRESENIMQFAQIFSDQALFQEDMDIKVLDEIHSFNEEDDSKDNNWNIHDISLYRKKVASSTPTILSYD